MRRGGIRRVESSNKMLYSHSSVFRKIERTQMHVMLSSKGL